MGRLRTAALVTAGAAAAGRLFAVPRVHRAVSADAIVALDGDRPRRVQAAVALASAGLAPVLVLVRGESIAPELVAARGLPFEVVSFVPDPPTTRGEARAIARLARERGWQRVLVVTSTYHVTRARLIFERALACDLRFVSAGCRRRRLPRYIVSESAKLLLALTLRRTP
jgi:uncharacterized SAM-binding protein YcdF (DUF218 family)